MLGKVVFFDVGDKNKTMTTRKSEPSRSKGLLAIAEKRRAPREVRGLSGRGSGRRNKFSTIKEAEF